MLDLCPMLISAVNLYCAQAKLYQKIASFLYFYFLSSWV